MSTNVTESSCDDEHLRKPRKPAAKVTQEKPHKKEIQKGRTCDDERIEKLECEVNQLRVEMECIKREREAVENAVQRAILRGTRALGGRYRAVIPGSIEELWDTCTDEDDNASSTSAALSCCTSEADTGNRNQKNSEDCCETFCDD